MNIVRFEFITSSVQYDIAMDVIDIALRLSLT